MCAQNNYVGSSGCLLGGISKLETSLWHLHILSTATATATSESFVACRSKERKKMLHKLHSLRQFQASRHATVDGFSRSLLPLPAPSPCTLAGSLSVSKNAEKKQRNKKRPAEVECQRSSTAPYWGLSPAATPSLTPASLSPSPTGDLLSLAMRAWAQMKRPQAASAVAHARAYL